MVGAGTVVLNTWVSLMRESNLFDARTVHIGKERHSTVSNAILHDLLITGHKFKQIPLSWIRHIF